MNVNIPPHPTPPPRVCVASTAAASSQRVRSINCCLKFTWTLTSHPTPPPNRIQVYAVPEAWTSLYVHTLIQNIRPCRFHFREPPMKVWVWYSQHHPYMKNTNLLSFELRRPPSTTSDTWPLPVASAVVTMVVGGAQSLQDLDPRFTFGHFFMIFVN